MQKYSDFFQTLHDEQGPTGYLGQGTHYSVLRAVVFHDPIGEPLPKGQFADFAVIWDEDHDVRVMEPIEEVYRRGLLSSFLMFGESKGFFRAVHSDMPSSRVLLLNKEISAICQSLKDPWSSGLRSRIDWATMISDDHEKVDLYLRNLEMLWQLGVEDWLPFSPALLKKVDDLELSVRATNTLKNDGIVYIGDLVQKTWAELLRIPNMGRTSTNEIREALVQIGLDLNMVIPGWPPKNIESVARCFEDDSAETVAESLDQAGRDQGDELQQPAPLVRRI